MISIHRIVLRRLFTAWLLASLLIGGIAFYVELEKIDNAVVALAATQAGEFAPERLDTGKRSPDELARLSIQAEKFVKCNFIVIEIHDRPAFFASSAAGQSGNGRFMQSGTTTLATPAKAS